MYILSIDQGTTGTRAILLNKQGQIVDNSYLQFSQIYPKPGWVEHNPEEIWQTVKKTIDDVCSRNDGKIEAIGITNQRETTIVWDKITGKPIYNAIVWQCRRTTDICKKLNDRQALFRMKTGLPVDAYFSGTKIKWILDKVKPKNTQNLLFGTIDTWLIWKLTNGETHATDFTNASRTMIFNIKDKKWDSELCKLLNIPLNILPDVKKSSDNYGTVTSIEEISGIPITGVAGDQQAALFGQTCFQKGEIKNTYGTGCFIMMNTGNEYIASEKGLITTLAINGEGNPSYALEGAIFIAGAVIQWLRDELCIITDASETEKAALQVGNNNGVYFVPAFVGLGTPHWNMEARGTIVGLTRGANKNHIIRAALESMAYQTHDVLNTMEHETGLKLTNLTVDGGASQNNFLMQFQSDIINNKIIRPTNLESTALGAGYLAGLKIGFWKNAQEIKSLKITDSVFTSKMKNDERELLLQGWKKALKQTMVK